MTYLNIDTNPSTTRTQPTKQLILNEIKKNSKHLN